MRTYETMVVIHPETTEEQMVALVDKFKGVIEEDGTVISADNWGMRKLAYPIQKNPKGIFTLFIYDGGPKLIAELERRLRIEEAIMLFQTVLHVKVAAPVVEETEVEATEAEETEVEATEVEATEAVEATETPETVETAAPAEATETAE